MMIDMMIDQLIRNLHAYGDPQTTTDEDGNAVIWDYVGGNRYAFDNRVCSLSQGWVQYDTDQDASYFGVWVHAGRRMIVTFAEGDVSIVECPDDQAYNAELRRMGRFYGTSPVAVVIDPETATRTVYYQDRDALFI